MSHNWWLISHESWTMCHLPSQIPKRHPQACLWNDNFSCNRLISRLRRCFCCSCLACSAFAFSSSYIFCQSTESKFDGYRGGRNFSAKGILKRFVMWSLIEEILMYFRSIQNTHVKLKFKFLEFMYAIRWQISSESFFHSDSILPVRETNLRPLVANHPYADGWKCYFHFDWTTSSLDASVRAKRIHQSK